jgi:hypothetical protein
MAAALICRLSSNLSEAEAKAEHTVAKTSLTLAGGDSNSRTTGKAAAAAAGTMPAVAAGTTLAVAKQAAAAGTNPGIEAVAENAVGIESVLGGTESANASESVTELA